MKLAQALKLKNRLAGDLVRQQQILTRENSRRSDSVSTVDRAKVWNDVQTLSAELIALKAKITVANIGIYPKLEAMSELKARIAFLNGLPKREGEEISFVGRDQEKLTYKWNAFINQAEADELVSGLQIQINQLQDEVDAYNATTDI